MPEESRSAGLVRFGVFELDRRSGELRKAGVRINLQEQALQVLTLLLERPGDLVTRDELRQRLWPTGTSGDFDHGLNAVINRLRDTLGDSADSPRFIETLPRRGYRFIAPIEPDPEASSAVSRDVAERISATRPRGARSLRRRAGRRRGGVALGLARSCDGGILATAASSRAVDGRHGPKSCQSRGSPATRTGRRSLRMATRSRSRGPARSPTTRTSTSRWSARPDVRRLTTDPAVDDAPSWSPDGGHIAFLRMSGGTLRIHVTSPMGGTDLKVSDFPVSFGNLLVAGQPLRRRGSRRAVGGRRTRGHLSDPARRRRASRDDEPGAPQLRQLACVLPGWAPPCVRVLSPALRRARRGRGRHLRRHVEGADVDADDRSYRGRYLEP